jgi:Leucine-rich repeat (LRR) protein
MNARGVVVNLADMGTMSFGAPAMTSETRSESDVPLIPDAALAGALRKELALGAEEITFESLKRLRNLDAQGQGISNLSGLEHCINLTGLSLEDNNVIDVRPISSLLELEILSLNANPVSDLTPIANLIELRALFIGKTNIDNLKFATNLRKLELFSFPFSKVTSLVDLYLSVLITKDNERLQRVFAFGNSLNVASYAFASALRNAGIEVEI